MKGETFFCQTTFVLIICAQGYEIAIATAYKLFGRLS